MNIDFITNKLHIAMELPFKERSILFYEAKEELQNEMTKNPNSIDACSLLAMINIELRGDSEESINMLQEYYTQNKEVISKEQYCYWATNMAFLLAEEEHDTEESLRLLESAVAEDSLFEHTYYALGVLYFRVERYLEAKNMFNKAYSLVSKKVHKFNEAITMLMLKKNTEAIELLESIYCDHLQDGIEGRIALTLGRELAFRGEVKRSQAILKVILENQYEDFDIWHEELAEWSYVLGRYVECVELYDRSNISADESWNGQYFYALKQIGKFELATRKFEEIVAIELQEILQLSTESLDGDTESETNDYLKCKRVSLENLKNCYTRIVESQEKPEVQFNYDLYYQCYYINCPRHVAV